MIKKYFYVIALMFLIFPLEVSSHDMEYGFTHNHYDYVVVAEIENISNDAVRIKVVDHVISRSSCGDNNGDHIPPENMAVMIQNGAYDFLNKNDKIVAVIDKENNEYKAIRIFGSDSADYRTLRITAPTLPESEMVSGDTAAFNDFVNSGGQYCDFSFAGVFDENDNYVGQRVTRGETGEVIYTPEDGYLAAVSEKANDIESKPVRLAVLLIIGVIFILAGIFRWNIILAFFTWRFKPKTNKGVYIIRAASMTFGVLLCLCAITFLVLR